VIIYERPMNDHICHIRQVVEASTPRWMFEGGMREAAREALALLRHEVEEQTEQSQYYHFLSHAQGAEAVVMPAGDHDHIGCFTNQVKLTRALVQDLDEAVKEVKLLGEHEEESSQKITELDAMCKRLREDAQKLNEEKTTLEGMVESRDELIMEMAEEYGLNHMGENDDDDDEGNAAALPAPMPPATAPEEILVDAEPEPPQPHLFNMIMRPTRRAHRGWRMVCMSWLIWTTWMTQLRSTMTWTSGSPRLEAVIEIESLSLSL
jgi:hypothetical protein